MTISERDRRYRWVIVVGLLVFMSINFAQKAVIGLAAIPIIHEFHLTPTRFGAIVSSFFILFSISAIVVGAFADRVRTRVLVLSMAIIWALCQLPALIVATPAMLMLSRIVLGASQGGAYSVSVHAIYKWFPDRERSLPTSILSLGGPLGAGVYAPLMATVIADFGWRTAFLSLAIVGFAWAAVWFFIGKEEPDNAGAAQGHAGTGSPDNASMPDHVPLTALLLSRTFLGSTLCGIGSYVALILPISWLPSFLTRVGGYSMVQVGKVLLVAAVFQMVCMPLLGWWSQHLLRRGIGSRHARGTLASMALLISGITFASLSVMPAGAGLIAAVVLALAANSIVFPVTFTLNGEIAPARQRATLLGIHNSIITIGALVTPVIMGKMIELAANPLDGYRTGMAGAGACVIVSAIGAALVINPAADRRRFISRFSNDATQPPCASVPPVASET